MRFYMARQPILNRNKNVVAYELLFRNSRDNYFPQGVTDNVATAKVFVNSYLSMVLEDLTEGKPALINFPSHFLRDHLLYMPLFLLFQNIKKEKRTRLIVVV